MAISPKPSDSPPPPIATGATGNLQPTNQVDVGIEISGTVASVEVDFNDAVQVGQVLARLDTSRLESQARKAEAGLDAARVWVAQMQATLTESVATLARLRAMHQKTGGKVPSQQDLDSTEATFKRTQTEVASAQAVEGVTTYKTVLDVDNADLALRPGMTTTADILVQKASDVLLIPNAALRTESACKAN